MRFASLQSSNTGDYASAGKAAADTAVNVFATQRKSGPDYGKLSQIAMVTNAEEKIASMQASAKVTNAGVSAFAKVTQVANNEKANKKVREIKNSGRKAGVIAGLGKMAAAGYLASRDNTKGREYPTGNSRELWENWRKQRDGIKARHDAERDAHGEYTPEPVNFGSTGTSGDDSGKVTTGGNSSLTSSSATGQTGWGRLSKVIRAGEGTSGDAGYTTMFTGARFDDTSRHPRRINRSGRLASDAAGAYQFLSTTWDGAKNALGLTDFSPDSQEKAGRYLTQKRGVDPDAVYNTKEELGQALDKLAPEWASMPTLSTGTSYYGQGGISLDDAWRIYNGG